MDGIVHGEVFDRRSEIPLPELSNEKVFPLRGKVKAVFDQSMKWQLVEEYGVGSFEEQPDGTLLFEHEYADDEGLISWMDYMNGMIWVRQLSASVRGISVFKNRNYNLNRTKLHSQY